MLVIDACFAYSNWVLDESAGNLDGDTKERSWTPSTDAATGSVSKRWDDWLVFRYYWLLPPPSSIVTWEMVLGVSWLDIMRLKFGGRGLRFERRGKKGLWCCWYLSARDLSLNSRFSLDALMVRFDELCTIQPNPRGDLAMRPLCRATSSGSFGNAPKPF